MSGAGDAVRQRAIDAATISFEFVVAAVAAPLVLPLTVLPWKWATAIGRAAGSVFWIASPGMRRVAMINLRRAFGPSMTRERGVRITRDVWRHAGASFVEGFQTARRLRRGFAGHISCEFEDPIMADRIFGDPRPRIVVTAHAGSWELATMMMGAWHGVPGVLITRAIPNRFANALLTRLRRFGEFDFIDPRGATWKSLARLRAGQVVGIFADGDGGGPRGAFVDLFGRPASTTRLPAILAKRTGVPITMYAALRIPGDTPRFRWYLAEIDPLKVPGRVSEAVLEITKRLVACQEAWIRKDPRQWYWMHKRWELKRGGGKEQYTAADLDACFAEPLEEAARSGAVAEDAAR